MRVYILYQCKHEDVITFGVFSSLDKLKEWVSANDLKPVEWKQAPDYSDPEEIDGFYPDSSFYQAWAVSPYELDYPTREAANS